MHASPDPRLEREVRQYAAAVVGPDCAVEPLGGLDVTTLVLGAGPDVVVKGRLVDRFEATAAQAALERVHGALAPVGLAPRLLDCRPADGVLLSAYERLADTGLPATPAEAGTALAQAHAVLRAVPTCRVEAWVGYYGEFEQFRFLVDHVEDEPIRRLGLALLPLTRTRPRTEPITWLHRDLSPGNIVKTPLGPALIDWDMAHPGHGEDDVAMALCTLADGAAAGEDVEMAAAFLAAYAAESGAPWAQPGHPVVTSAVALAGLRQAVAGWYNERGDTAAPHWANLRHRIEVAQRLTAAWGS